MAIHCDACNGTIKDYIRDSSTLSDWVVEASGYRLRLICKPCEGELLDAIYKHKIRVENELRRRAVLRFMKAKSLDLPSPITLNNRTYSGSLLRRLWNSIVGGSNVQGE